MLPKAERLTTEDVRSLTTGRSVFGTLLSMRMRPANSIKCSVSVSKKVAARAVDRNRLRRRVYAVLEKKLPSVQTPSFLLVMPKKECLTVPYEKLAEEVHSLLKKSGLSL